MRTGLDVLLHERLALVRGRKVGVLCHPASVTAGIRHIVDALLDAGVRPHRLFGPEHGIRGDAQDMIEVADARDPRTGIPVVSLYGASFASLTPGDETLADLDVLLVDLQDVGSRYYTYVWTTALAMQTAARTGTQVLVLDRPNPIGGVAIEGGAVEAGYESFVGLGSVPNRHGMTIGELALMVRAGMPWGGPLFARPLDVDVEVVPLQGWRREHLFEDTRLPWVLPSPNMPTVDTAVVYPGQCLLEATNASEGRGTTRPFEIFGAPYVDGYALAAALDAEGLPGVRFRPLGFLPTFQKHAGVPCGGVQMHVTDRQTFRPYRTGIAVLRALHRLYPGQFAWRTHAYEFVTDIPAIDLLAGSTALRTGIEAGASLAELVAGFAADERAFAERRAPHLLYR